MDKLTKKLELFSNIAIIIVASMLATVLVKSYLFRFPSLGISAKENVNQPVNGTKLPLADIDWKQSNQTLLLAISSTCHFCTDSAPFYRRVVQTMGGTGTRIVAVLPQSIQEGKEYLKRLGVSVDEIRQVNLNSIGVQGTPTLLLVDNSGVVKNSWFGKLPVDQEESVINSLLGKEN
jgi:hypothetical protein